jgi:hypothetical protein
MSSVAPAVMLAIIDEGRAPPMTYRRRARELWPRLSPVQFGRANEDLTRLAALVARRTALPREAILLLLTGGPSASLPGAFCPTGRGGSVRGRGIDRWIRTSS